MVIGSGPIVIGQAAEFDYAGTQACRSLKEEGIEVVLVNSNPATIMTDKEIADFANARWNSTAYVDKLDAIITQKWLHFGFLVSREAWSDIRRTGYPSGLVFPEVSGTIPNVPNRWRYPSTEVNYNPYYKDVAGTDTYTEKLFWAK